MTQENAESQSDELGYERGEAWPAVSSSQEGQPPPASGDLLGHISCLIKPTVGFPGYHLSCASVVSHNLVLSNWPRLKAFSRHTHGAAAPCWPLPPDSAGSPRHPHPPLLNWPRGLACPPASFEATSYLDRCKPRLTRARERWGLLQPSMLSCLVNLDVVVPNL